MTDSERVIYEARVLSRIALREGVPYPEFIKLMKQSLIAEAIKFEYGNKTRAAKRIGVHRNLVVRELSKGVQ